jgi:enoyl-CoA hydratase/carnithine racemase
MFLLTHEREIARLTLDRQAARNAIPAAGWGELADRIGEIERSDARLLILSGEGGAFCAGADLADFPAMREDEPARFRFREAMRQALDRLRGLPIPAIAWIDGDCYGAGVALAMACDLRIASERARFAITPARIGISYPQEDVYRLVELVGGGQAARLLFTAHSIDGGEAARIGLVEFNAPEDGLEAIVGAIAGNDRASLATLKRSIRLAAEGKRIDAEQDRRFDALIGSDEMLRRLEALRRK